MYFVQLRIAQISQQLSLYVKWSLFKKLKIKKNFRFNK